MYKQSCQLIKSLSLSVWCGVSSLHVTGPVGDQTQRSGVWTGSVNDLQGEEQSEVNFTSEADDLGARGCTAGMWTEKNSPEENI
ncbi:hypothetical protein GN956_G25640 [Arapaima gigas]